MDKKRFIINLVSNLLSALSGIAISFFLTPYILSTLGKEAYGFFPLSNNFLMYAGIITTALNSMSGRFIAISLEQKNIKQVNVYFNSILFGNMLTSLFFILLSIFFYLFIDTILDVPISILPDVKLLFAFMFLAMTIGVSSSVFSVALFALNRLDKMAFITIVSNVLKLGVIVGLFLFFTPKIYFLGVSSLVTALYSLIVNYKLTKRLLPEVVIDLSLFSWGALTIIVGSGIWNSVLALSNVINTQLDLLLANKFFGASDMGVLSLTKVVPTALQLLLSIIVPVFLPEMLKAYANKDMNKLKEILNFSFKSVFLMVLVPMAVFLTYGQEFFKLWLPSEDSETLYYISILTLAPFIIHATIETVYHVFVITNKLKIASFWGIFISLLNLAVVLLLCLYSNLGIYAIPIAALITGSINHFLFAPFYAAHCLQENKWFFTKKMFSGLLGFAILIAIANIWKFLDLIAVQSWLTLFINAALIGTLLFIISLFVKFDRNTIASILLKLKQKMSL